MVTQYGKVLRKIRIDRGEVLGDMAYNLKISISYLSSIETGARKVPQNLTEIIAKTYSLNDATISELRRAEVLNLREVKMSFNDNVSTDKKEMAVIFARTFNSINDEDMKTIREILEKRIGRDY